MTTTEHPGRGRSLPQAAPLTSLRDLERRVSGCRACGLHRDRSTPVVAEGPVDAELMVIGSVPGRHEDLQGKPLAGASANVLHHAFSQAGIDRAEVHLSSVVRCRPADDRRPAWDEVEACLPHLRAHIDFVAPKVLVALGEGVTRVLLGRPVSLSRVAGYRLDVLDGVTLIPTYHPSDVVRGVPQASASMVRDLATARAVLEGRLPTGAQALADARARTAASG